ncbi:MAG: 3-oxoacyl-ACP synthase III [Deltaproteobacteria bacterium]|nr:3-oxoacyl-ACP synthase III [Deltaproteobacteria bacterium]
MLKFLYKDVVIKAMAVETPPIEVTSAELEDKLAPLYERLGIPLGTLEKLSGIKSRYLWDKEVRPSQPATKVAESAISTAGIDKGDIDVLINCSVTRDYFEPATAALVHRNLGLKENSLAFDITNACIGFSDGLIVLSNMIEQGAARAGVIVTAEAISRTLEICIEHLIKSENLGRDKLLQLLPTLTLGSSAVAFVVTHKSLDSDGHRLVGAVSRTASEHNELCIGNDDFAAFQGDDFNPLMETESAKLIAAAAKLGGRTWRDASEAFGWSRDDVDHIFCHQVGRQVNDSFYQEMGLDISKEFTVYKKYGNPISAALPTALVIGSKEKQISKGEKVLLTAFGSGLNCRFIGIEW